jgi:transcription elongation factor Elf1
MINESKFIHQVMPYLDRAKEKSNGSVNFRCPICGDGKTKYKTRAWFIQRDSYVFHCFNCNTTMSLQNFFKDFYPDIYKEFIFEKLKGNNFHSKISNEQIKIKSNLDTSTSDFVQSLLKPVTDYEIVLKYLEYRLIDLNKFKDKLFLIEDFSQLMKLEKYKFSKFPKEPRLTIPIYNKDGLINGIISRAISKKSKKRYINLKFDEQYNYNIFGLYDKKGNYDINLNKKIIVCEGAFDSMLLDNAIAVNTSDLLIAERALGDKLSKSVDIVYVPDNEPRNKEITEVYNKIISADKKIVIMPDYIKEKDITDIKIADKSLNIMNVIKNNTYQGLKAQMKFNQWKKI